MIIKEATIRKILDSRGNPTVEVDISTANGFGRAAAPSGASTGSFEVAAWPSGGVKEGLSLARLEVLPSLLGLDVSDQHGVDAQLHEIDGTDNFSRIGGNVSVAISLAAAKAAADSLELPFYRYVGGLNLSDLPMPLGNVLGGGAHAVGGTTIQEYLVTAFGSNAAESVMANARVHHKVKKLLEEAFPEAALGKGDEGAWTAQLEDVEALELVSKACQEMGDELEMEIRPSLDLAASEFYHDGHYHYRDRTLTPEEQVDFVVGLVERFNLYAVEDPLDENDFASHAELTSQVGKDCLVVGDDLYVTNTGRLEDGISQKATNAILIKPNQVGTLTDTLNTVALAHRAGFKTVISHRSGETTDNSIAHLGVGLGCHMIKTGTVGGERLAKLNTLIRIEEELT